MVLHLFGTEGTEWEKTVVGGEKRAITRRPFDDCATYTKTPRLLACAPVLLYVRMYLCNCIGTCVPQPSDVPFTERASKKYTRTLVSRPNVRCQVCVNARGALGSLLQSIIVGRYKVGN